MTLKQQACFMIIFCWYEKGLLNFVSKRIKLVYRINTTHLAFQTSKTTIIVVLEVKLFIGHILQN